MKNGVDLVGETGKALEEIVFQVNDINTNVVAIVEAAKEQATGLKEINQAVNTLDQATQQNAAMVEESTAASHKLAGEAEELRVLLSQFRLGAATAPARSSGPTPATARSLPSASPARQIVARVAKAHGAAAAATASSSWEEF